WLFGEGRWPTLFLRESVRSQASVADPCLWRNQRWNRTRRGRLILRPVGFGPPNLARAGGPRGLKVHLPQPNNNSPYAFVRAKFKPGEVGDPWAVRFFDDKGKEIPYFVWDAITWRAAREGRADWGKRYALLNHAPGDAPEVLEARARKLQATQKALPEL